MNAVMYALISYSAGSYCQLFKKDADACMMLIGMTHQKPDFYIPEEQRTWQQWAELKTAVKFWFA